MDNRAPLNGVLAMILNRDSSPCLGRDPASRHAPQRLRVTTRACIATSLALIGSAVAPIALAQSTPPSLEKLPRVVKEAAACAGIADATERLACYDDWAASQPAAAALKPAEVSTVPAEPVASPDGAPAGQGLKVALAQQQGETADGCHNPARTELSRFWELEDGSDCGTFRMRGYRPLTASFAMADYVDRQPTSPSEGRSSTSPTAYRQAENRIQLSVRTKLAQGLFVHGEDSRRDSLWFAYSQQSYWQLFSGRISRPFRTTDHEPELIYVYPNDWWLPGGWRWRMSGLGLVHQSNGQSLPLSRSWNRVYVMGSAELGNRWQLQAKVWQRVRESHESDDNPGIANYIGRAELRAAWNMDADHTFALTVRHSLTETARGSVRLEWLRTLGDYRFGLKSNLRLHTQLFSGYGDSLIDYNRRRTVFSVGFSLLDF